MSVELGAHQSGLDSLISRDVRHRFSYFGSVSIQFLKNLESVRNEFGLVQFKKNAVQFGYCSLQLFTTCVQTPLLV